MVEPVPRHQMARATTRFFPKAKKLNPIFPRRKSVDSFSSSSHAEMLVICGTRPLNIRLIVDACRNHHRLRATTRQDLVRILLALIVRPGHCMQAHTAAQRETQPWI